MDEHKVYFYLKNLSNTSCINLNCEGVQLDKEIVIVSQNYNYTGLLRLLNVYLKQTGLKSFLLLMEPFEFINSDSVEYIIYGVKNTFKSIKVTKNNIIKGLIEGYFAYYGKKQKQQKGERSKIIYVHPAKIIENGFEEVKKLNWLKPGAFRSTYIYGPQLTKIRHKLINLYKNSVISEYSEIIIPKFTNEKIFARSNHIRLPEHTYIIAKFEPEKIPYIELNGFLFKQWRAEPNDLRFAGVSTYGVCEPFWSYLENTVTDSFRYFDNSGPALRNEGNAIKSLERLDVFSRIELIFAEPEEAKLIDYIETYIEKMKQFFNKLDLYYRILEVDSWTAVHKTSKQVKTYDFEIYLTYKDQWLEVCNISNNGIIFSKQFNVRAKNNEFIYTGCGGIGIERLLFSVIEQKGYAHIDTII